MIVKVTETILKGGGHVYMLRLAKEREESDRDWAARRDTLAGSIATISTTVLDANEITLTLNLLPGVEDNEFDPSKLSEEDLLRELGAVDPKNPGQIHRNDVLDPIYEEER